MTPVEALEAERAFLLRSLEDLDAEHTAGDLPEERYEELRDAYTVQAATILRALARAAEVTATTAPAPSAPRRKRARRLIAVACVAATVAVAGAVLVGALGERGPGQTITGNAQSAAPDLGALARATRERPQDAQAQLDYGHALLAERRTVDALKAFDRAARIDPKSAEAKAFGGWILFLAGLTDDAVRRLDAAVAADPAYPQARFFRGMALVRGRGDRDGGLAELREFVRLAPPGPERESVQALIDELVQSPTTTPGAG